MHKNVKLINFSKKLKLTNHNDYKMTSLKLQTFLNLLKWGCKIENATKILLIINKFYLIKQNK